jgi:hypothetical protein
VSLALWLALLAPIVLVAALVFRRANELFALGMRDGKLAVLRGRLPPALFGDLAEIIAREPLLGELRVVSEGGLPRLTLRGASQPGLEQAARNVLGRYQVAQIRAGRLKAGG